VFKPLFKGLRVKPFVKCANCHVLFEYGSKKCPGCAVETNPKEDQSVYLVVVNMGERYTPFVECPNCRKLVKVGVRRCRDCYEELTEEYAIKSAMAVVINTIACNLANAIKGSDPFAILAVIGTPIAYALDMYAFGSPTIFYLILFWPMIPLLLIILWFYRFGKFSFGDDEYLSSKRAMNWRLRLWLAILAAQVIAIALWWL